MNNSPPVISVQALNKSFDEVQAVIDFSLELRKGDICGFLGPNGGGKTTALRMLCGLLKPDSGSGQCLGYDIVNDSVHIKKYIGYMPQKFSLYGNLSVYENLNFIGRLYSIKDRAAKIEEVVKLFRLQNFAETLARNLSGGLKQRLSLASCLLHQPKLLLLDEPTGGIDSRARRDFWDELFILSEKGITTLISTHYMDEAERCTYLAYISQNLIVKGTIPEIIQKAGLVTWMARGDNLVEIARILRTAPGIDEVAFFGEELHVSGKNEQILQESISPFQQNQWQKISPRLEDALMDLIKAS